MKCMAFAAAAALALAGCAGAGSETGGGTAAATPPLVGTQWRLIHFESSDDAIGTLRPNPNETFSLLLNPDGSAAMQFACNRGTGRWSAPDPKASTGELKVEPLAVTMAACPPSPVERFSRDLANVRTFVIADGRLHLNLMLDSGNYVLEPVA